MIYDCIEQLKGCDIAKYKSWEEEEKKRKKERKGQLFDFIFVLVFSYYENMGCSSSKNYDGLGTDLTSPNISYIKRNYGVTQVK